MRICVEIVIKCTTFYGPVVKTRCHSTRCQWTTPSLMNIDSFLTNRIYSFDVTLLIFKFYTHSKFYKEFIRIKSMISTYENRIIAYYSHYYYITMIIKKLILFGINRTHTKVIFSKNLYITKYSYLYSTVVKNKTY